MRESTYVYLADDHQIIIDGLTMLLKNVPGIIVIGSAGNGQKAYEDILYLKPDLVILDVRMPDRDGLQLVRDLKNKVAAKFIILSMHQEKRYINDAINYGADAYILKATGKEELLNTIHKVMNGERIFHKIQCSRESKDVSLSPRELDIFRLIINEYTSQQIAEKLLLSQYTVDTHRRNIMQKTGAKNIVGLVKFAVDNNIGFTD